MLLFAFVLSSLSLSTFRFSVYYSIFLLKVALIHIRKQYKNMKTTMLTQTSKTAIYPYNLKPKQYKCNEQDDRERKRVWNIAIDDVMPIIRLCNIK